MKRNIQKFYNTEKGYWISAFFCVLVLFIVIVISRGIVFDTVDDFNVMYTIAGYKTGTPYFQLTFYNNILAFLISLLYRLTGAVQWYSVVSIAMVLSSILTIDKVIIKIAKQKKIKPVCVFSFVIFLEFTAFLYPLQRLQFTTTATMMGAAAVALMLEYSCIYDKKLKRVDLVLSGIFLILCFMERRMSFLGVICFWGLIIGKVLLSEAVKSGKKGFIKKFKFFIKYIIVVGGIILSINIADQYIKNTYDNKEYMKYDEYRGEYQDYPKLSFDDFQYIYDEVSWNRETYEIVSDLVYIDPNINEQAFRTLVEEAKKYNNVPVIDVLWRGKELIRTDKTAQGVLAVCIVLFVTLLYRIIKYYGGKEKERYTDALVTIFACLGAFIISYYLCMKGRFLLRIFLNIALPTLVTLSIEFVNLRETTRENVKKGISFVKSVLFVLLCIPTIYLTCSHIFIDLREKDLYSISQMHTFEDYAIANPDKVFVHDYSVSNSYNSYDPFRIFEDEKPTNIIISGGSYTYTGCYNEQLRINNLDKLDGETFSKDNVYYVCNENKKNFWQDVNYYLRVNYNFSACKRVEQLDHDVSIYQFISELDYHYTGWYEYMGEKMYLIDGNIQTGEQLIDGKQYVFYNRHAMRDKGNSYYMDIYGLMEEEE